MKTNLISILWGGLLCLLLLAGCKKDRPEEQEKNPVAAVVTAGIEGTQAAAQGIRPLTTTVGNNTEWTAGDQIGLTAQSTGVTNRTNVAYVTTAGDGNFTVINEADKIYFQDDEAVNFSAYYPYSANGGVITANTTSQSNQNSFDFLYATATADMDNPAVNFTGSTNEFKHRMSRVVIKIQSTGDRGFTEAELKGATYKLSGIRHSGTFNTVTGEAAVAGEATADWEITGTPTVEGGVLTYSIILFPQDLSGAPAVFTATIGGRTFVNSTTIKPNMQEGVSYAYTITVRSTGLTMAASTIASWNEGAGAEGDACIDSVVPSQITMITENNGRISITIGGTGTATVDFGDGATQDYTLNSYPTISHSYATAAGYTITIAGGDITYLSCGDNNLTSLDVSNCTALTTLYCSENPITSMDVRGCTELTELSCQGNNLTSLDVSSCTALTELSCGGNQLTSLDVSSNTALTGLDCSWNQLTSLDVSSNTALTRLHCSSNQLTSLNVSSNTALTILYCWSNQLTALDVSQNTALIELWCHSNPLTSLDVSKNTVLNYLHCFNTQITSLDVSSNTVLTDLDCRWNQLTSDALNALFGTLHSNTIAGYTKTIYIVNNPGTNACDQSIATAKGWEVINS